MPIFTPPSDNWLNLSDFDVETPPTQEMRTSYKLLRHFRAMPRGRNIYKLAEGVYVENEPADMSTVVAVYYGGHDNQISDSEAVNLTEAGYGTYIS